MFDANEITSFLMQNGLKSLLRLTYALLVFATLSPLAAQTAIDEVSLYRTFEKSITNTKSYTNHFVDAKITASYVSPSGKSISF